MIPGIPPPETPKLRKGEKEIRSLKKAQQILPMNPRQRPLRQRLLVTSHRGIDLDLRRKKIHQRIHQRTDKTQRHQRISLKDKER
jgi:hypothetical protein